jgi:hypothetical protein
MHVPPGTEDDALLGMEALFNELPTGDVHHVDPLKIGAVVKKASRSPQIDAMVEESSLTSPQTDSSMGYTAAEAKASTTSHTESTTDHTVCCSITG